MESSETDNLYQLVFEGPSDDSSKTLQKIKGVFIADLEFPVSEVQRFLDSAPIPIINSKDEASLQAPYKLLKNSGARVCILSPKNTIKEDPVLEETALEETVEDLGFEFSIEETPSPSISKKENQKQKVYSLSMDDDGDLPLFDTTKNESAQEIPETPSSDEKQKEPESTDNPLLSLLDEEERSIYETENNLEKIETKEAILSFDEEEPKTISLNIDTKKNTSPPQENMSLSSLSLEFDSPTNPTPLSPEPAPPSITSSPEPKPPLSTSAKSEDSFSLSIADPPQQSASPTPPSEESESSFSLTLGEELKEKKTITSSKPQLEQQTILPEQDKPPAAPKASTLPNPPSPSPTSTPKPTPTTEAQPPDGLPSSEISFSKPKKKRGFMSIPYDLIIPILVGSGLLGAANWYYFSLDTLEPITLANKELTSKKDESAVNNKSKPKEIYFVHEQEFPDRKISLRIETEDGKPTFCSITAITPPPPDLTKEEIVQRKIRFPWLKKVEVKNLRLTNSETGTYHGQGPAMAYIDYKKTHLRIVGKVELKATLNKENPSQIQVSIHASNKTTVPLIPPILNLEFQPPKEFHFSYAEEATLELKDVP